MANIIGWFGCSVPFTGYFFVVWILQFLFRWDSRLIFFSTSYWKLNLMCWPPPCWTENLHQQWYIHLLSFSEAITVKLLSPDKMAELPHRAHRPVFFFCFVFILTFGPIEIKAIDLTCALCFSNMYYHNAFNFWHITLRSFPKVLFLQLSLCVQCVTGV